MKDARACVTTRTEAETTDAEKGSRGQGAEHMVPEHGQRMRKTDELRPLQRL